ncbi:MAG TPA: hypothetical protein VMA30_14760 [Xanthobacteraceae bacterium]|nr:hypothetical protein [Xanthobacteraceae bacterium]
MSIAGLAAAIMSSQGGLKQIQLGQSFERMNADHGAAIANLVDSAQQNIKSLANVSPGTGSRLNAHA